MRFESLSRETALETLQAVWDIIDMNGSDTLKLKFIRRVIELQLKTQRNHDGNSS